MIGWIIVSVVIIFSVGVLGYCIWGLIYTHGSRTPNGDWDWPWKKDHRKSYKNLLFKEDRVENVRKHLSLLGMKVEDKVTGATGVVDSVGFDLYGCIQASVNPGLGKDGKPMDCRWFDIGRLTIKSEKPVMDVPNFDYGPVAEGKSGAASKTPMHTT